jgi:hypothetical protein
MASPQTPDKGKTDGTRDGAADREQVHFYPGDKLLLYIVDGEVQLSAEAWGGPPVREPDEPMDYLTTHAGTFVIDGIMPYSTKTWPRSRIRWGTPIRESRTRAGKIEYRTPSGGWRPLVVKDEDGSEFTALKLTERHEKMYGLSSGFPKTWFLNDFGPKAVRYYEDRNQNRKRDPNEPLKGEMIHTTPKGEAETEHHPQDARKLQLTKSHGCIHIRPIDRNDFISAGAFRQGMTLVIHQYDESYRPSTRKGAQ